MILDSTRIPPAPVRVLQRVLLKAGALGHEGALAPAPPGPPRFLIRVDEFPHYEAIAEPRRYGSEAYAGFHDLLHDHGVPYLIAALPTLARDPLDPAATGGRALDADEAAMLRRIAREDVAIALHGYDHRTRRASPRRRSELAGLGTADLHRRLDAGEAVLTQLGLPRPRVFVAPYNRFDRAQYPELARRYDVVCGGPETVVALGFGRTPAWLGDAVYLPAYPPLYGTAAEVEPAARRLIEAGRAAWVPIVLHWGWEIDRGFDALRRLAGLISPYAASWEAFLAELEPSR
jgi:peptidoglycan/xylan/chitin deacetylase (PgdA/CDA1 family)